jgi:hypothetical protein
MPFNRQVTNIASQPPSSYSCSQGLRPRGPLRSHYHNPKVSTRLCVLRPASNVSTPWQVAGLPMRSLPVGQLPRVYRQTLRNGISSITGGAVIPPLLGLHCLVSVKQCVQREGKTDSWIRRGCWRIITSLHSNITLISAFLWNV